MKKLFCVAASAALFLAPYQASAQNTGETEAEEELAQLGELMQGLYKAEPLTADEEVRLPAASLVVWQIMPDGAYVKMMQQSMDQILNPLMIILPETMPSTAIAASLGISEEEIEALTEEQQAGIADMLDPQFSERGRLIMDHMMGEMTKLMAQFEPGMRSGLSRAYAKRFSAQELEGIAEFFATPIGAHYASESMSVFTDPQTMSGMMEAMPAMMEAMPEIIGGMEQAVADLPPQRDFAALSKAERERMAGYLGISVEALRAKMQAVADAKAALEDAEV